MNQFGQSAQAKLPTIIKLKKFIIGSDNGFHKTLQIRQNQLELFMEEV